MSSLESFNFTRFFSFTLRYLNQFLAVIACRSLFHPPIATTVSLLFATSIINFVWFLSPASFDTQTHTCSFLFFPKDSLLDSAAGSRLAEALLKCSSKVHIHALVWRYLRANRLNRIATHRYGNYFIQQLLCHESLDAAGLQRISEGTLVLYARPAIVVVVSTSL